MASGRTKTFFLDVEPKKYRQFRTGETEKFYGEVKIIAKDGKVLTEPVIVPVTKHTIVAEKLRRNASKSEMSVVKLLADLGFEHSVPMLGYYLDFYNEKFKVAVEIDGPVHLKPEQKQHDRRRNAALRKSGIRTWRFKAKKAYNTPNLLTKEVSRRLDLLRPQ